MTENGTDPAAATGSAGDDDATAKGAAGTDKGGADLQAEVDKWKALARQHENLWKSTGLTKEDLPEAKALIAKAREADVKSKTAEDRIAALERKIEVAEANAMRLEVASAKGLTPAIARRLVGATREELEADADELLKVMKPAEADKGGAGGEDKGEDKPLIGAPGGDSRARPKESLRSGATPQAEPEENDPTKLAALIPRG